MMRFIALCLGLVCAPLLVSAHALQPGYLELRALGDDTWGVFWRKPDVRGQPMQVEALLPLQCETRQGPAPQFDGQGWSVRWVTRCPGGLSGGEIRIHGLEQTRTDVLIRYELKSGQGQAWRLVPGAPVFEVPTTPGAWDVARSYTWLGGSISCLALTICCSCWRCCC